MITCKMRHISKKIHETLRFENFEIIKLFETWTNKNCRNLLNFCGEGDLLFFLYALQIIFGTFQKFHFFSNPLRRGFGLKNLFQILFLIFRRCLEVSKDGINRLIFFLLFVRVQYHNMI